jgi:disulfide bond formation protein DsbB
MPAYVDTFNLFVSLGVIVLQCLTVLLAINLIFLRTRKNAILIFFKTYGFLAGFLVSLGSIALSLFYSNIIGFPPCELCWLQRIFIYPQVILFGMDLYKRSRTIVDHSLVLAIIASLISLYHVYVENGGSSSLACATGNAQVSCATRYVFEFGYITVPVMALTASVFIIVVLINHKYMSRG